MKLTKETLKRIIKEELNNFINEEEGEKGSSFLNKGGKTSAGMEKIDPRKEQWAWNLYWSLKDAGTKFVKDGLNYLRKQNPEWAEQILPMNGDDPDQSRFPGATRGRMQEVIYMARETAAKNLGIDMEGNRLK